jgi:hypothetical protein
VSGGQCHSHTRSWTPSSSATQFSHIALGQTSIHVSGDVTQLKAVLPSLFACRSPASRLRCGPVLTSLLAALATVTSCLAHELKRTRQARSRATPRRCGARSSARAPLAQRSSSAAAAGTQGSRSLLRVAALCALLRLITAARDVFGVASTAPEVLASKGTQAVRQERTERDIRRARGGSGPSRVL